MRWILRLLNVETHERRDVLLLLILNALTGIPIVFTAAAGGALFLEQLDATQVPWVYLTTAVVIPLTGLLHSRLGRSLEAIRLLRLVLVALVVAAVGLRLLVGFVDGPGPVFLLLVGAQVQIVMLGIVFWSTTERILTLRQSKRLFGLVSSGQPVVAILGGLATPWLARTLGTANLLWLSVGGVALYLLVFSAVFRSWERHFEDEDLDDEEGSCDNVGLRSVLRRPYLRTVFAFAALAAIAFYVSENLLFLVAEERFPDTNELAGFLGKTMAAIGILSLILKMFVTGALNVRFGVRVTLLVPAIVAIFTGGALVFSVLLGAPFALLFWLGAGMGILTKSLDESIRMPAYYSLFQPLPARIRATARNLGETVVDELAGGIAGLLLLVLLRGLGVGLTGLAITFVVVALAWVAVAVKSGKGYRTTLGEGLRKRGLSATELPLNDPDTLAQLRQALGSDRPNTVIYAVDLLRRSGAEQTDDNLADLLCHPDDEVRLHVATCLDEPGHRELADTIAARIPEEPDSAVLGMLLRAYGACEPAGWIQDVLPRIDDQSATVRWNALVALLRWGGLAGAPSAKPRLLNLQSSDESENRRAAAWITGEVGAAELHPVLFPLLEDGDDRVRREAFRAVGRLGHPSLLPSLVTAVHDGPLRASAITGLLSVGAAAVPVLLEAIETEDRTQDEQRRLVGLLGRLGGTQATEILLHRLGNESAEERGDASMALRTCGFHASPANQSFLDRSARTEIALAARILTAMTAVRETSRSENLVTALDHELHKTRKRIFILLALETDRRKMEAAWHDYRSDDATARSIAVELVEDALDRKQAAQIIPLLDDLEPTETLRRLPAELRPPTPTPSEALLELAFDRKTWPSPWLAACTLAPLLRLEATEEGMRARIAQRNPRRSEEPWAAETLEVLSQQDVVERVGLLRASNVFHGLPDEELAAVANRTTRLELRSGETLFCKGDSGESLFALASGRLRIHDGDLTLAVLEPGAIVGELAALSPEKRSASVTTTEDSILLQLECRQFEALLADNVGVARAVLSVLVEHLRTASGLAGSQSDGSHRGEPEGTVIETALGDFDESTELSTLEKVIVLRTTPTFSETPEEILAAVADVSRTHALVEGEILFSQGESGHTMYVVISGRLKVHVESRWIADLGPRAIVGELAVFASEPRIASVTAVDDSLLLGLTRSVLFELISDRPEVARGIIEVLVERLRGLNIRIGSQVGV